MVDDMLVAAILAASTTEARLCLAKCVSLSWDMRADAHDAAITGVEQRPRQDSNLRPAD